MASCYVHAIDRIFHWWYRSTLPRPATVYEYVHHIYARYHLLIVAPVWPSNLVSCALFNTLHHQQYSGIGNRGGMSRERFFFTFFIISACWYFFPGYIFQALSVFSWVTWIAPDNIVSTPEVF